MEAGLTGYALKDLTGAPYEYFQAKDPKHPVGDEFWRFIQENLKKRYILIASRELEANVITYRRE
jgi:hypothetical protein